MEKLITVKDVRERYGVTGQTARRYMRRMPHMENPLTVFESDLTAWETSRMEYPGGRVILEAPKIDIIVPRKRRANK